MRHRLGHMLFDGAHGYAENLGDLPMFHVFESVQHENVPSPLAELLQGSHDPVQFLLTTQYTLGRGFLNPREFCRIIPLDRRSPAPRESMVVTPAIDGDLEDVGLCLFGGFAVRVSQYTLEHILREILGLRRATAFAGEVFYQHIAEQHGYRRSVYAFLDCRFCAHADRRPA